MKPNMGGTDRFLRGVVGLALIGWGVWSQNWWGALGAIFLVTALVKRCPAYVPFKWNTGSKG